VLLSPRISLGNALLWAGPLLVLAVGIAAFVVRRRAAAATDAQGLSVQEEAALSQLTDDEPV